MNEYVYQIIGDQFKEWHSGMYLIKAGTGRGKTEFVKNQLYNYNHNIIMFVNRTALKNQNIDVPFDLITYQHYEYYSHELQYGNNYCIPVITEDSLISRLNKYEYIVLDEAHYLYQDSTFNRNTDFILKAIDKLKDTNKIIMLSATPYILEKEFTFNQIYDLPTDYSYIVNVFYYTKKEQIDNIINNIPETEKVLFFGSNKERLHQLHSVFPNSVVLTSDNKSDNPEYRNIIEQQKFSSHILFTTKVIDNGVNIVDRNVKHIIIELSDIVDFIQCLGRKRVIDDNDTINLYIYYDKRVFINRQRKLDKEIQTANHYKYMVDNNQEKQFWIEYDKQELPKFFDHNGFNVAKYKKTEFDYKFAKSIAENKITYINYIDKIINNGNILKFDKFQNDIELKLFLETNHRKQFYGKDKDIICKAFNITRNRRLIKSVDILNQYLQDNNIPYVIKEKSTPKPKRKKYWIILKLS